MPFNKRTPIFGLPVFKKKDTISQEDWNEFVTIIENQLIANAKGVHSCVFEDGVYRIVEQDDGKYTVTLTASGSQYSLSGIVGHRFIQTIEDIVWKGLTRGRKYYLYICKNCNAYHDSSNFHVEKSIVKKSKDVKNFLFLAEIDLTEEFIEKNGLDVEPFPDGKLYGQNLSLHLSDNTNPHGDDLYQDKMYIRENLYFKNSYETMELWGVDGGFNPELIRKAKDFRVMSNGIDGVTLELPSKTREIFFVDVNEEFTNTTQMFNLGQTTIGFYGKDDSVKYKYQCKVYNSGKKNVPMRVFVYYR